MIRMKAKVIIENSETTVILTPKNEFELDVLQKMYDSKDKYSLYTHVTAKRSYGADENHQININVKEIR